MQRSKGEFARANWSGLRKSDVAYRWLAGGVPLNCHGLVDFRVESVEVLDRLLTQSVTALIGEGLVKLVEIAVDGTKIRASASKQSFKTGAELLEVEAAVAAPRPPPRRVLDDAVASFATGRRESQFTKGNYGSLNAPASRATAGPVALHDD